MGTVIPLKRPEERHDARTRALLTEAVRACLGDGVSDALLILLSACSVAGATDTACDIDRLLLVTSAYEALVSEVASQ